METDATTAVTPQSWGQIKDGARIEETRHGWSAGATELASRMTPLIILGSGPHAREMADIVAVATCQASIVFLHELRALGVDTRLVFPPRRFESTMPLIDDWVAGANAPTAEADVAPEAAAAAR